MNRGVYSHRNLPEVHLWKCPLKCSEYLKKPPSQTKSARVKPKDSVTLERGHLSLFRYPTRGNGTYLGRGGPEQTGLCIRPNSPFLAALTQLFKKSSSQMDSFAKPFNIFLFSSGLMHWSLVSGESRTTFGLKNQPNTSRVDKNKGLDISAMK